jgi:uncharacterized protein (DUF1684 family)
MDESYFNAIKAWRKDYEAELGAPDGWLSISGLFWLKEGENRIGAAPACEVTLPQHTGLAQAGTVTLAGHQITLTVAEGVRMTLNDEPLTTQDVKINDYGSSDWFFLGKLKFAVIQRGTRYGVRIYDPKNPARRKYYNIRWFPVNEALCVQGKFIPNEQPMTLSIMSVLGDISEEPCPGRIEFTLGDQACTLYPIHWEPANCLRLLFKDATNASLTFPGGRFLDAQYPQEGIVTLDFNKSFNPPCAYTMFATCPLPPDINKLPVQILAGEMNFVS